MAWPPSASTTGSPGSARAHAKPCTCTPQCAGWSSATFSARLAGKTLPERNRRRPRRRQQKRSAPGWIGLSFIHGGLMTSLLRTGLAAAAAATVLTGTFAFAAANAGRNGRVGAAGRMLPCNIYAAAHPPCVAAYSTVRALYASFDGPLYQVRRASDQAVSNIGLLRPGGAADAAAQDAFCAGTSCTISMIYDQSGHKNHLAIEDHDQAASATELP